MSPAPVLKAALDSGICSPKRPPGSHPQALSLLASPSRGSLNTSTIFASHSLEWLSGGGALYGRCSLLRRQP